MSDDLDERVELLEEQLAEMEDRLDRVGQAYVAVDKLRGQIETLQKLVYDSVVEEEIEA